LVGIWETSLRNWEKLTNLVRLMLSNFIWTVSDQFWKTASILKK
jgi:hypothetical protein